MNLDEIDAIIFGLGGVIVNIDYLRMILAFNALHDQSQEFPYSQDDQADLFDAFEKGEIDAPKFRDELRRILHIQCDDQCLDQAWNAMLVDMPLPRIELLEALSRSKRLFILSNTNAIHKLAFDKIFQDTCGDRYQYIDELFEQAYYSHLVGDRKPNLSIFQKIIDENNLDPSRTLFIEDSTVNLENAEKLGLQTYHMEQSHELADLTWLYEMAT